MSNQMNKINERIVKYTITYRPLGAVCHSSIVLRKRNQAKRLSKKLRGK